MKTTVPLRTYRLSPRKARLEVGEDEVVLVLPSYFGRRRWHVPVADVAVCDLTSLPEETAAPVAVFPRPVTLPYLFTTGPVTDPTTALLFRRPRLLPPVRLLWLLAGNGDEDLEVWGSRRGRAVVDGVLLRAVDPPTAVTALARAGVEVVADPETWLASHREVATDPVARAAVEQGEREAAILSRARVAVSATMPVAAGALALFEVSDAGMVVGGVVIAAAGVLSAVLRRRARRAATLDTGSAVSL